MREDKLPSRRHTMLCALLTLALLGLSIPNLLDTITLHRSNGQVDARVIDARTLFSTYGTSYDVKYVFQSALNSRPIGRKGFIHDNLWSSLPEAEWKKAVETGNVSVKFDPSNPSNNAPLVQLPSLLDESVPIIFGLFFSFCVVVIEVRRKRLLRTTSDMG